MIVFHSAVAAEWRLHVHIVRPGIGVGVNRRVPGDDEEVPVDLGQSPAVHTTVVEVAAENSSQTSVAVTQFIEYVYM